ncbi:MAG: M48 family metallopeptidase [Gammaproteobacteria bacterium]|nr:M48 family metallopeptidase [Gammaproteobacteria bacterium]
MRLTVSLEKGVEVVVPKSMSKKCVAKLVPTFIKDKKQWLKKAIEQLKARSSSSSDMTQCEIPTDILLPALGQTFFLSCVEGSLPAEGSLLKAKGSFLRAEGSISLRQTGDYQLEVKGDLRNKKRIFELLEVFFKDYAKHYLKERLDQLSVQFSLPYHRLTVRAQKTRWGSCSSKKNISLNYRLLFIEKKSLDYILVHELVHTLHMNHSSAYWTYFESLMPDARVRDREINRQAKELPCWIFHKVL